MSLVEMIEGSSMIVIAKVQSVDTSLTNQHYAQATVLEVWKGEPTNSVEYLASPTWTCDIAEAKVGETVVLFLTKSSASRSYMIVHSGRGRMPVRKVGGKDYVDFWGDLILPEHTETIKGPDGDDDIISSISVATLKSLVLAGCAKLTRQSEVVATAGARTFTPSMTETRAMMAVTNFVQERKRSLKNYEQPSSYFDRKTGCWLIGYWDKPPTPGGYLLFEVDPTGKVRHLPGE